MQQTLVQIQGIVVAFAWSFGTAIIIFSLCRRFIKLRVSPEDEIAGLNVSEHGASTELIDLITEMDYQEKAGSFDRRVEVEPHTEVGQIAAEYNRVLDRIELEFRKREMDATRAQEAQQEAMRANQVKSDFLANMSHELRTPLGIITGYIELIREELKDSGIDRHDDDIRVIAHASEQLLQLINGVLDISKIESGHMQIHLQSVDIYTLLEDMVHTIQPLIREKNNQLRLEIDPHYGSLVTDQTKLEQSLLNLLSNAAKFTENGIVTLRAIKRKGEDGVNIHRFEVIDSGIGMSEEVMKHIFDAFTQADGSTTRKYGGTGLGLAITRNFCEMLSGSIQVESIPGKGSRFIIELPGNLTPSERTFVHQSRTPFPEESYS